MVEYLQKIYINYPIKDILDELLIFAFILTCCYIFNILLKRYLIRIVKAKIRSKTKPSWFTYRLVKTPIKISFYIIPGIIIYITLYYTHIHLINITANFFPILTKLATIYLIFACLVFFTSFLNLLEKIYSKHTNSRKAHISIKSILDIFKIILWILISITSFAIVTDTPLANIFAGIGAVTAVIAFVFQDAIKNFVACMQIVIHDLASIGDWVAIPNTKADGIIKHISFNIIQIENSDKTIITLPTQALVVNGLINSKHLIAAGNRRIKRLFKINTSTVYFISKEKFDELSQNTRIGKFLSNIEYNVDLTNLELFRIYLINYLNSSSDISKKSILLVHLLDGTDDKYITVEILASTHENFVFHEAAQSKIIENSIAILEYFGMKAS